MGYRDQQLHLQKPQKAYLMATATGHYLLLFVHSSGPEETLPVFCNQSPATYSFPNRSRLQGKSILIVEYFG